MPRLRLPLPERTGSDRDELHCPHGFVDRAYSVFLLRCVAANYSTTATSASSCCVHPPFAVLPPRRFREHLLDSTSRLETRVRAPGRSMRPSQLRCDNIAATSLLRHPGGCPCSCGGGPEDHAPMEVPDLRAVLPNFGISLPQRDPLPPSAREPEASRPVSARDTLQSACQSPPRSELDSIRSCIPYVSIALADVSRAATGMREGTGRHGVTPLGVTLASVSPRSSECAASRSRLSPQG